MFIKITDKILIIRAEAKFNGYIVEYIYDYYVQNGTYPSVSDIKDRLNCFRDLIAYRIVISMPQCHIKEAENREIEEINHLYKIANVLPQFLEERGFTVESARGVKESKSDLLDDTVRPYYRDCTKSLARRLALGTCNHHFFKLK